MGINKKNPAYQEYLSRCRALSEKYLAEEDAILAQYPTPKSLDHPAGKELREMSRRHNAELRMLQKEYAFLFEES